jgi:hypothetical protein
VAILSPNTINITLLQDGQAAGSITPSDIRISVSSLAGRASATKIANYTLVLTDAGTRLRMNVSGTTAVSITIPPNSSVPFDVDTVIVVSQVGTAPTSIVAGAGVTINSPPGFLPMPAGLNARITLHKDGTDIWELSGELMPVIPLSTQTANYTLALADANTVLEMNSASALSVTVPPNSSVAFPIGIVIELYQLGAGQITVAAGAGVTFQAPSSLTTRAQYSTISLRKRATDVWAVSGDAT